MASEKTIQIVKSTVPVLLEHGEAITKAFYKRLFVKHPELKNIFNMTHQKTGSQPKVLANAIFQYAAHIDKLEMLGGVVGDIAHKHASLSITPEMYPIVGENLLLAIKDVLGEAATPEIIEAWAEAYGDLATIFIQTEESIYEKSEKAEGGYRGKKAFVISKKEAESEVITSFYLRPKDGSSVPSFLPGQYISLSVAVDGEEHLHTRNYSLSDFGSKEYLRISVKKEEGNPNGIVSNYLHNNLNEGDEIEIGIPAGNFFLKESDNPAVLIAGGVGVTPVISMYKALVTEGKRDIVLIQCALNSNTQAFAREIAELKNDKTTLVTLFSEPSDKDTLGGNYDYQGFLSKQVLENVTPSRNAEFYFCGPTPFMANVLGILSELSIPDEQINYEFFGPKEELEVTEV